MQQERGSQASRTSANEDRKHQASIVQKKKKAWECGRKEAGARLRTGKELGDLEIKDY
jgi:hypothetical protein